MKSPGLLGTLALAASQYYLKYYSTETVSFNSETGSIFELQ